MPSSSDTTRWNTRAYATSLAQIIHEAPTAIAYLLDLVDDFSVRLLDVLSSTPPVPNAEIIHHSGHLRDLATALHE